MRNIAQKIEFLNSFVSLTAKRNINNMFWRVRLSVCLKERKERNKEKKEIKTFFLSYLQNWVNYGYRVKCLRQVKRCSFATL